MKINLKQEQLIKKLFDKVKEKYPEIVLRNLSVNPEDKDSIWINITADMDEDRQWEMMHYCSILESEIEETYGYSFTIMPSNPRLVYV